MIVLHHIFTCSQFCPLTDKPEDSKFSLRCRVRCRLRSDSGGIQEDSGASGGAIMGFTSFISVILLAIFAVLKVEGTAKGAVPLDTLTFDKVFLK